MKSDELKNLEEDDDWNFEGYGDDELDQDIVESIEKAERPTVTGLRSRFSNGQAELVRLSEINNLLSKYSFRVASYEQDIGLLWKYYGILDEFWESMRNIFGSVVNNEIMERKKRCRELLDDNNKSGQIERKVFNNLLALRSQLYRLKQLGNFGIEVDRTGAGTFTKAKRKIVD